MNICIRPLWGLLIALVLTVFTAQAQAQAVDKMDVAILNLESAQVDVAVLASLTAALRDEAKQIERYNVSQTPPISVSELALILGCEFHESSCLQEIAGYLETRIVIFGTTAHKEDTHHVTVDIFDAKSGRMIHTFARDFDSNQNLTISFRREIAPFLANPKSIPTTRLEITANVTGADIRLDDVLVGHTPFERLGLPPGNYRVELSAPGFETWNSTVTLVDSGEATVKVALTATNAAEHLAASSEQLQPPGATNWWAWTTLGVGGVALGASGVLALMMNNTEQEIADRINNNLTQRDHQDLIKQGENYQLSHMVLLGVGAVGVTAGLTWLLVDSFSNTSDDTTTTANAVQFNLSPASVSATWRW